MYDYAGEWAYRVGLPAKSGVGGGIVAVVPGQLGIGIFSPLLDARGNSVRGIKVCEELSRRFGLHAFEPGAARMTRSPHSSHLYDELGGRVRPFFLRRFQSACRRCGTLNDENLPE